MFSLARSNTPAPQSRGRNAPASPSGLSAAGSGADRAEAVAAADPARRDSTALARLAQPPPRRASGAEGNRSSSATIPLCALQSAPPPGRSSTPPGRLASVPGGVRPVMPRPSRPGPPRWRPKCSDVRTPWPWVIRQAGAAVAPKLRALHAGLGAASRSGRRLAIRPRGVLPRRPVRRRRISRGCNRRRVERRTRPAPVAGDPGAAPPTSS